MLRWILVLGMTFASWAATVEAETPRRLTLELELEGEKIEGMPLAWSKQEIHLLGRDGRLWQFHPDDPTSVRKKASNFKSYSASEIRTRLLRELGKSFEVTGTGHYLVAHPRGQRDLWGQRFEDLYRSFVHYFGVRGFKAQDPEFPLTAIVFHNQRDFINYASSEGYRVSTGVLGFYSPSSNRIMLFDIGAGRSNEYEWHQNAMTIIHEAAHQTAFNIGIHSRFAEQPRWVIEGLGTFFEAPGVWDSRNNTRRSDRINYARLRDFKAHVDAGREEGSLIKQIASDRRFRSDPTVAYAEAWALTYWLVERQPRQYAKYMKLVAKREAFKSYPVKERVLDFTAVFGKDLRMTEARFMRFMKTVK